MILRKTQNPGTSERFQLDGRRSIRSFGGVTQVEAQPQIVKQFVRLITPPTPRLNSFSQSFQYKNS